MFKIQSRAFLFLFFLISFGAIAQQPVVINNNTAEYIFKSKEIVGLEDPKGELSFDAISSAAYQNKFKPNVDYYPKNYNRSSTYWYRVKVRFEEDFEKSSPALVLSFPHEMNKSNPNANAYNLFILFKLKL